MAETHLWNGLVSLWSHSGEPKTQISTLCPRCEDCTGGEGVAGLSGAGHFNMEASTAEPTSSARIGPGQPKAKDNRKASSALKMCLTDFPTKK